MCGEKKYPPFEFDYHAVDISKNYFCLNTKTLCLEYEQIYQHLDLDRFSLEPAAPRFPPPPPPHTHTGADLLSNHFLKRPIFSCPQRGRLTQD